MGILVLTPRLKVSEIINIWFLKTKYIGTSIGFNISVKLNALRFFKFFTYQKKSFPFQALISLKNKLRWVMSHLLTHVLKCLILSWDGSCEESSRMPRPLQDVRDISLLTAFSTHPSDWLRPFLTGPGAPRGVKCEDIPVGNGRRGEWQKGRAALCSTLGWGRWPLVSICIFYLHCDESQLNREMISSLLLVLIWLVMRSIFIF